MRVRCPRVRSSSRRSSHGRRRASQFSYHRAHLRVELLEDRRLLSGDSWLDLPIATSADAVTADPTPLSVLSIAPKEVRNAAFDHIDITFSEAVDPETFGIEDVAILGPAVQVAPTEIESISADAYRVHFSPLTLRGTYRVAIGPQIMDLSGNFIDQNGNGIPGEPIEDVYHGSLVYISADVTLTSPTTIDEADSTYDGKSILVEGTAVTINGIHGLVAVHLVNGALLTHPAATETEEYRLELDVTEDVIIDSTSKIDVSGKGYLRGRTLGNTTEGGATRGEGTSGAGGSYGGIGGYDWRNGTFATNAIYGDYAEPNEVGSGGAYLPGGGLVRLEIDGVFQLDGVVQADGAGSSGSAGSGSGGGVYVRTHTLTGSGVIHASGGSAGSSLSSWLGSAGSGGRVAVYAEDYAGFDIGRISAVGGRSEHGTYGGTGTVYLCDTGEDVDELIVADNASYVALKLMVSTPLEFNEQRTPDSVMLRGTVVDVSYAGSATSAAPELTVADSASVLLNGAMNWADVTIDGATLTSVGKQQMTSLAVVEGGALTHPAATETEEHRLELEVTQDAVIDSTSRIDVTEKGYLPKHTIGNTTEGGSTYKSGGSYGGLGAPDGEDPAVNAVYGDYGNPSNLGSGGGGGPGGGLVHIEVGGTLQLNGGIVADAAKRLGGSGSGGGIRIVASSLAGSGFVRAGGGHGWWDTGSGYSSGAGGGGRVAVYAGDYADFNTDNITAPGGYHYREWKRGGAGTVYVANASLSELESPAIRQTKRITPPTFDGPNHDVDLTLRFVAANQPVEVFAGATLGSLRSLGTFTNSSAESSWLLNLDVGTAGLSSAEWVAVTSTAALLIESAVGLYPDLSDLDGYEEYPALPRPPIELDGGNYDNIAQLYQWNFSAHGYLHVADDQLTATDWSKKTVILTHGWNDRLDAGSPDEFMRTFALDFEQGREGQDVSSQWNILAVDWNANSSPYGSDPNGVQNIGDEVLLFGTLGALADANKSAENGILAATPLAFKLWQAGLDPENTLLIGHSNGAGFMANLARSLNLYTHHQIAELVALDAPYFTASYWAVQQSVTAVTNVSNYFSFLAGNTNNYNLLDWRYYDPVWILGHLEDGQGGFGFPIFQENVTNFSLDRDISNAIFPNQIAHTQVPLRYATTADTRQHVRPWGFQNSRFVNAEPLYSGWIWREAEFPGNFERVIHPVELSEEFLERLRETASGVARQIADTARSVWDRSVILVDDATEALKGVGAYLLKPAPALADRLPIIRARANSPVFASLDVNIPPDSALLTFQLNVLDPGNNDVLVVGLGNQAIMEISLATEQQAGTNLHEIWIAEYGGQPTTLSFYMPSDEPSTAEFLISDMQFAMLPPTVPTITDMADDTGTSDTDSITQDDTPTFTWTASQDVQANDVAGYWWSVDATPPESFGTFTTQLSVTLDELADGDHVFYVRSRDQAEHLSAIAEMPFKIDTTPPASQVASLPLPSFGNAIFVSWSGTDEDNGSGLAHYDVYFSDDGSPYQPWLQGTTQTSAAFPAEDGHVYAFYSIAHDIAGNSELAPATPDAETTFVANRAPVVSAGGPYVISEGENVMFDGSASHDPDIAYGDAIDSYAWDLDADGNYDDAEGATPQILWATLQDLGLDYPADPATGLPANTISLRVVDTFGAATALSTTLIIYDNRAFANFTGSPNPGGKNETIEFDASTSYHGHPDRSIVSYAWDFGDGATYSETSDAAPDGAFDGVTTHLYAEFGSYTVTLAVSDDNAEPTSDETSHVVTIANRAPILDDTGNASLTAISEDDVSNIGDLISEIIASVLPLDMITDADSGAEEGIAVIAADMTYGEWGYSLDAGVNWTALGAVSAADARLLAGDGATRIRFVPNRDFNGVVDPGITFYAWDQTTGNNGGVASTLVTGGITAFSSNSETASVTVNAVNDSPSGGVFIDDTTPTEDQMLTATNTLADADGLGTITYMWERADNLAFDAGVVTVGTGRTFTPGDAEVGKYVRVTASYTDGHGTPESMPSAVSDAVANVNDAPVLTPIGNRTIDEQTTLTFTATATDQDLPAQGLTFSLDAASLAAGMTITPSGEFSWTPTEAQGGADYTVTITVTDDGTNPANLSDSKPFTITVAEVNVSPVLAPIGTRAVDEQATLAFQATATDQDLPTQGPLLQSGCGVDSGGDVDHAVGRVLLDADGGAGRRGLPGNDHGD